MKKSVGTQLFVIKYRMMIYLVLGRSLVRLSIEKFNSSSVSGWNVTSVPVHRQPVTFHLLFKSWSLGIQVILNLASKLKVWNRVRGRGVCSLKRMVDQVVHSRGQMRKEQHSLKYSHEKYILNLTCEVFLPWLFILVFWGFLFVCFLFFFCMLVDFLFF